MSPSFDAIVVGSGPSGVSVAFPLLEAGLRVLLVDGGKQKDASPPSRDYLHERTTSAVQWEWMIGQNFHSLQQSQAPSPKFRTPTHGFVFDGFSKANRIDARNFTAVGSLASGGLSNAWGCGVARLSNSEELAPYPVPAAELKTSYEAVSRRIGISGASEDDLAEYFGVDDWAQPPIQLDTLQKNLFQKYSRTGRDRFRSNFRMGRSRVAVLSRASGARQACDLAGTCLWGCHRDALYSSSQELPQLQRFPNLTYRPGFIVEHVSSGAESSTVIARSADGLQSFQARRVFLAAGTLATTRLVLQALGGDRETTMQCSPTAAFMLWMPRFLGRQHERAFGLGQLSFALEPEPGLSCFGSLFNSTGIPLAEYCRYAPLLRPNAGAILGALLSSCVIGNAFLPGHLVRTSLRIGADGVLRIEGKYLERVFPLMEQLRRALAQNFRRLGAFVIPGSFKVGEPGSDIHYAATLPMRADPRPGETACDGEVVGLPRVHVVDGACLPELTEKSHTLTLMANADRIGRTLAPKLHASGV